MTVDMVLGNRGGRMAVRSVSVADSAKWVRRATVPVTDASPMALPEIDKDGKILAAFHVDASGYTKLMLEPGRRIHHSARRDRRSAGFLFASHAHAGSSELR